LKKSILISAFFIIVLLISIITGCNTSTSEDRDFNLIFRYGVHAGNELNTFKDEFTKDMILDPSIKIKMTLTEEELESIYNKMKEIDFFSYPDVFTIPIPPDGNISVVTPYLTYYFKVEFEGGSKELYWEDEIRNKNEDADRLRELTRFIEKIVESKEEYKKLPEPTSAYL
jgi:hypothetical protein